MVNINQNTINIHSDNLMVESFANKFREWKNTGNATCHDIYFKKKKKNPEKNDS